MEGRKPQDAGAVRHSSTFSGRQVPLEMGKLRVGGSGKPVPAVFPKAVPKRARIALQEAPISPHATFKPFSQDPFRRNVKIPKTMVQVSLNSFGSSYQKKSGAKSSPPARSPHSRFKSTHSTLIHEDAMHSAERQASQTNASKSSNDSSILIRRQPKDSIPIQMPPSTLKGQQPNLNNQVFRNKDDRISNDHKDDESRSAVEQKEMKGKEENSHSYDQKMAAFPTTSAMGTFVSSLPSLTKLQCSFTARELALFTQRVETAQVDAIDTTRYHVASHRHSIATSMASPIVQMKVVNKKEQRSFHKQSSSPSMTQPDPTTLVTHKKRQFRSWQQVDSSLDHNYENDPSIDLIQLHLLHQPNTLATRKKQRQLERERNLAAASNLREQHSKEQQRLNQNQQRKVQLQHMSEFIRLQNQKAVQTHVSDFNGQRWRAEREASTAPELPKRKPPVPRLSRPFSSGKPHQSKHNKKTTEPLLEGVSTSILMGRAIDMEQLAIQQKKADDLNSDEVKELQGSIMDKKAPLSIEKYVAKRNPPSRTPRGSKKKNQQVVADERAEAAMRAREKRRAIAREYMQLQQQSRLIGHAKAKEQSQRKKIKRQRQLELLDATRLKNLRVSSKRPRMVTKIKKDEAVRRRESLAMPEVSSCREVPVVEVENALKSTKIGLFADHGEELSDVDHENVQAIGNLRNIEQYATELTGLHGNTELDGVAKERIQKLLELRKKATALSARLNGLRNRTDKKVTVEVNTESVELIRSTSDPNETIEPNADGHLASAIELKRNALDEAQAFEQEQQRKRDRSQDELREEESKIEKEEDQGVATPRGSFWRDTEHCPVYVDAAGSIGKSQNTEMGEKEIDIRSIGVHNLEVVWPLQPPIRAIESTLKVQRIDSLSSSLSSSSVSSPRVSSSISQTEQGFVDEGKNCDGDKEEAFEVTFYQQLKNRCKAPTNAAEKIDSKYESEPDFETFALQAYCNFEPDEKTRPIASPVNEGLVRLVLETDDSLSVIDRAAKILFRNQQERAEREQEDELRDRIQAEKETLVEKEVALAAVMASVTDKKVMSEGSSSDEEMQSSNEETVLELLQYKRLEEIMAEVEKERAQATCKASSERDASLSAHDDSYGNEECTLPSIKDLKSSSNLHAEIPSSVFWDHLVAETSESQSLDDFHRSHHGTENSKPFDSSQFRHRNVDEQRFCESNASHREHSPRALSKKLLAAVDYQEAILGAHMQLSKMEGAFQRKQELKQANLRECSVQTEPSPKMDAATCAALCIETSTSPIRLGVDAAVQHDEVNVKADISSFETKYGSEGDNEYDETFEDQSQGKEGNGDRYSSSEVPSIAESLLHSSSKRGEESESDKSSVLSHQASDNYSDESDRRSLVDKEESIVATNVVESTIDDEVYNSHPSVNAVEKSNASVSMSYEDDFEASSPKPRVLVNQMSQEVEEDDAEDELEVSKSTERTDDIEDKFDCKSDSVEVDEAVSEDVTSDYAQSNDSSCSSTKEAIEHATTARQENDSVRDSTEDCIGSLLEMEAKMDSLPPAYLFDLKRRKQAEESLLHLRLKTVEQKFKHQVKQLEIAVKSKHEFQRRKETLTMAVLAEKANVESLIAASTARYYQDLHTFRSLLQDWPHAVDHEGRIGLQSQQFDHNCASAEPYLEVPLAVDISGAREQENLNQCEEYADEFASDSDLSENELIEEKSNDNDIKVRALRTLSAEHLEANNSSNGHHDELDVARSNDYEQEKEEETSVAVHEEDHNYDHDTFVSISEDSIAQSEFGAEAESASIVSTEGDNEHRESEYADDFGSISENAPYVRSERDETSAAEDAEVDEQDVVKADIATDVAEITSENDEMKSVSSELDQGAQIAEMSELDQSKYSDDFDSRDMDQSALPPSDPIAQDESLSVVQSEMKPSESEDSSMTTRLVAEVASLREAIGMTWSTGDARKLARKKVKVTELLQVKERLVSQQTETFRCEEEKRYVDLYAKLALQVDVVGQVRRAKDAIVQQLTSEFHTFQQKYPMLKANPSFAEKEGSTKERQTPSVLSKLFGKDILDASSVVDEGYEEEYEAESLERENRTQSASESVEIASIEPDQVGIHDSKQDEVEEDKVSDEIESEGSSQKSESDDEARDVQTQSIDDANDYENESFDDVESGPDTLSNRDEAEASVDNEESDGNENENEEATHEKEDIYSDENFDSASESLTQNAPSNVSIDSEAAIATEFLGSANESEEIQELTEAIENAVAQLEAKRAFDLSRFRTLDFEDGNPSALHEGKSLACLNSISQSHDVITESFTASIEERTARLEALDQQIQDRKKEILAVQLRMRVERRRGKLVAQEKLLWDEMESVQRSLKVDEEALALCNQRNRLDMMLLEERHAKLSTGKNVRSDTRDLLLGFDYLEDAQTDPKQRNDLSRGKSARASHTYEGVDLLDGYIDIEPAEAGTSLPLKCVMADEKTLRRFESGFVDWNHEMVTAVEESHFKVGVESEMKTQFEQRDDKEDADSVARSIDRADNNGISLVAKDLDHLLDKRKDKVSCEVFQQETCDMAVDEMGARQETLVKGISGDLLGDYAYVEVVEIISEVNADLLVDYDYVEIVTAVDSERIDEVCRQDMPEAADFGASFNAVQKEAEEHISTSITECEGTKAIDQEVVDYRTAAPLSLADPMIYTTEIDCASEIAHGVREVADSIKDVGFAQRHVKPPLDKLNQSKAPLDSKKNVDRVTALLYADLIQELDEEIPTAICDQDSLQAQIDPHLDEAALDSLNDEISATTSNLERERTEIAQRMKQSLNIVPVKSTTITPLSKVLSENGGDRKFASCSNVRNLPVDAKSCDTTHSDKRGVTLAQNLEIIANQQAVKVLENETLASAASGIAQSERILDIIFASEFEKIVDSELQLWSRIQSTSTRIKTLLTSESQVPVPTALKQAFKSKEPLSHPDPLACHRTLARHIVGQLQIVTKESRDAGHQIQLPAFDTLTVEINSSTAHALYDTIGDLARNYLHKLQPDLDFDSVDKTLVCARVNRHVMTEIDALLAFRAQMEYDVERQVQWVSNDSDPEKRLSRDVLVAHNCIDVNVANIVWKVQSALGKSFEELKPTPRPSVRVTKSSILSLLRTQQEQELQQRISQLILDDLLAESLTCL